MVLLLLMVCQFLSLVGFLLAAYYLEVLWQALPHQLIR